MADFDIFSPGDIFDSRDVIKRWDELDSDHGALQDAIDEAAGSVEQWQEALEEARTSLAFREDALSEAEASGDEDEISEAESEYDDANDEVTRLERELAENEEALKDAEKAMEEWEDYEEYAALKEFVEDAENVTDWNHGATFIADDYFETYAREFADDIGATKRDAQWPLNCIDWAKATEQLQADYQEYNVNSTTYWVQQG